MHRFATESEVPATTAALYSVLNPTLFRARAHCPFAKKCANKILLQNQSKPVCSKWQCLVMALEAKDVPTSKSIWQFIQDKEPTNEEMMADLECMAEDVAANLTDLLSFVMLKIRRPRLGCLLHKSALKANPTITSAHKTERADGSNRCNLLLASALEAARLVFGSVAGAGSSENGNLPPPSSDGGKESFPSQHARWKKRAADGSAHAYDSLHATDAWRELLCGVLRQELLHRPIRVVPESPVVLQRKTPPKMGDSEELSLIRFLVKHTPNDWALLDTLLEHSNVSCAESLDCLLRDTLEIAPYDEGHAFKAIYAKYYVDLPTNHDREDGAEAAWFELACKSLGGHTIAVGDTTSELGVYRKPWSFDTAALFDFLIGLSRGTDDEGNKTRLDKEELSRGIACAVNELLCQTTATTSAANSCAKTATATTTTNAPSPMLLKLIGASPPPMLKDDTRGDDGLQDALMSDLVEHWATQHFILRSIVRHAPDALAFALNRICHDGASVSASSSAPEPTRKLIDCFVTPVADAALVALEAKNAQAVGVLTNVLGNHTPRRCENGTGFLAQWVRVLGRSVDENIAKLVIGQDTNQSSAVVALLNTQLRMEF